MYNNYSNSPSIYFQNELNARFNKMLTEYNSRDASIIEHKISQIKEIIDKNLMTSVSLKFGGSLNKNTYIEGISDFDILVNISNTTFSHSVPRSAIDSLKSILITNKKSDMIEISVGQMAVTIKYSDNYIIQLLPVILTNIGYRVPASNGNEWSNTVIPERFINEFKDINQRCNNKVIPVIKLVKGINSRLPEYHKLNGYHIESIALEVFNYYPTSNLQTRVMIEDFYDRAKEIVKHPIPDKTGQSSFVDGYLGPEYHQMRTDRSNVLDGIYKRMKNADRFELINEWESIIGYN